MFEILKARMSPNGLKSIYFPVSFPHHFVFATFFLKSLPFPNSLLPSSTLNKCRWSAHLKALKMGKVLFVGSHVKVEHPSLGRKKKTKQFAFFGLHSTYIKKSALFYNICSFSPLSVWGNIWQINSLHCIIWTQLGFICGECRSMYDHVLWSTCPINLPLRPHLLHVFPQTCLVRML